MESPLIIINNAAARARLAWPVIRESLNASGLEYELHETTGPGDATVRVTSAIERGCNLIAVVGGDGTLSEAATGLFSTEEIPIPLNANLTLAILPAGTGNDFAHTLGVKRLPLGRWVKSFVSFCQTPTDRAIRRVDVVRVRTDNYTRSRICINASTLGLGGETAARVASQGKLIRRLSGEMRFVVAALGALAAWRERPVRIEIDRKRVIEGQMNLIAVANARFAGAGMMLSPTAELEDGLLDVVTASGFSRPAIIRELLRIHKGGHVANPKVRIEKGSIVAINTPQAEDAMLIEVDGNLSGYTPADYLLMPAALRVVAPILEEQS